MASSADSGKSFGPPVRLDDVSALGRVDVALLDDGSAAATWIEFAEGKAQFRMRRVTAGGELIVAWTESGSPSKVATARVAVPKSAPTR